MTLTNYWWLLIWLFLGGAIFRNMPKRMETLNGRTVDRWDFWPAILMVVPYIIWAGCRDWSFGDSLVYQKGYREAAAGLQAAISFFVDDQKDAGYYAFQAIMKSILGNREKLYFTIIAAFQLICVALTFRRYSTNYWACIFLFVVSTDYLSWMHNGIRQFIACAIIFAGLPYLVNKQYWKMILLILFASMFHGSVLLMIPFIFIIQGDAWNIKTLLLLLATAIVVTFVDQFSPILHNFLQETQYDDMMTNEIWTTDDGTNIIRVAVYSVPALLSLLGLKHIRAAADPVMNICVNCSIVTMALYLVAAVSSGIYIGRLPIYTTLQGYIALPWMIDQIFEKRSAKLVRYLMYGAYLAFFYYQMHFTWGII